MAPEDALPTIAEIAVTLAGFTGILFAIQATGASRTPGQSDRILAVLTIPAQVLVCSLLPFALVNLSDSPRVIWGIPLCTHALVGGFQVVRTFVRLAAGEARLTWPRAAYLSLVVAAFLQLLALASGLGLMFPYSPGILVLGLIWSLLSAGFALVTAVIAGVRSPAA